MRVAWRQWRPFLPKKPFSRVLGTYSCHRLSYGTAYSRVITARAQMSTGKVAAAGLNGNATMGIKVSDWLELWDSHDIYPHAQMRWKCRDALGMWPPWTPSNMVGVNVGPSGQFNGDPTTLYVTGWEMAAAFAYRLIGFRCKAYGRGTVARNCIHALRAAGL